MLALTHTITGAAVGSAAGNSAIALTIGVLLHFISDKIPHYWPTEKKWKASMLVIDWSITSALLIYLYFSAVIPKIFFWGGLGGFSVDLLLIGIPWFYHSKIGKWHSKRQPHKTNPFYWFVDIGICLFFVIWWMIR